MALNALTVKGIRAFDDKKASSIEFFSPVTVIVGANGSGKTTIIECLKYATTGDQPPNTRGGAFVHDPQVANEKEVKAEVSLIFQAADGERMSVTRYLNVGLNKNDALAVKKASNHCLAAEAVGTAGERRVISNKTPEIDAQIPRLLGVSKAVLENVIFCHQEESYWPLAESGSLKKKFDEIFEATRYTKALTNIRELRKDRVAELEAQKERLTSLQREKQHAEKINIRISKLEDEIASKERECKEAKKLHDAAVAANRQLDESASGFREVFKEVEILEEKKRILQANYNEVKLHCKEILPLTEEELLAKIASSEDDTNALIEKRRADEGRAKDLEGELTILRQKHSQLSVRLGSLTSEAETQKARIDQRDQLIHETSSKYQLKADDGPDSFLPRLQEAVGERNNEYARLNGILREKTDVFETKQCELDSSLTRCNLEKENIHTSISQRQTAIAESQEKLDGMTDLSARLEHAESAIRDKKASLASLNAEIQNAEWDDRIDAKAVEGRQLEEARESLNHELATLSSQSNDQVKLAHFRASIKAMTDEMFHILSVVNSRLRELGVDEVDVTTLEDEVELHATQREQQQSELEKVYTSTNTELQLVQSTLLKSRSQLESKNEEAKALDERLASGLRNTACDSLEAALKEVEIELKLRQARLGILRGGNDVYRSLLRVGKEQKTCSACKRHMNDQELSVFEKSLQDMLSAASPSELMAEEVELKRLRDRVDGLRKLQPLHFEWDQVVHQDIPLLETQIKDSEALLPHLLTYVAQTHRNLDKVKAELQIIDELKEKVRIIAHFRAEILKASDEAAGLGNDAGQEARTTLDIQRELREVSTSIRRVEDEKRTLQEERAAQKDSISALESGLQKAEYQELELRRDMRDKVALEAEIEKMNHEIAVYLERIEDLDANLLSSEAALKTLKSEFRKTRREMVPQITAAERIELDLSVTCTKFYDLHTQILRYVDEERANLLEECSAEMQAIERQIQEIEQYVTAIREACKNINEEINSTSVRISNWRENIRIRKLERELQETQADINSRNLEEAARSRQEFEERYQLGKNEESRLNGLHSHLGGELETHRAALRGLQSDLKDFGDINKNYKEQLILVKMSEMANRDLGKYARALDTAIMRYHGLKMQEVNDTMRHLWNRIYQGTDIDGIKIVSDADEIAEGATTTRRYYNYRASAANDLILVVMTKDQVELDMRGRCSAGQKMLASIIVRLALSDSFGQNCGILALDEPTNALDAENVEALADSLVELINERRSHSNFQLILITHDENFLRRLAQNDVVEHCWRVSRNERQKSEIAKERVRDM